MKVSRKGLTSLTSGSLSSRASTQVISEQGHEFLETKGHLRQVSSCVTVWTWYCRFVQQLSSHMKRVVFKKFFVFKLFVVFFQHLGVDQSRTHMEGEMTVQLIQVVRQGRVNKVHQGSQIQFLKNWNRLIWAFCL